jgi:hypothetical protein
MGKQLRQKARAEVREARLYLADRMALRPAEAARALGIVSLRASESGDMGAA